MRGQGHINLFKSIYNETKKWYNFLIEKQEALSMFLYYVRHGDPIYNPDSLTELGHAQAEALSKRLSILGFDKIYVSSSNRARQTAEPTCKALGMEAEILDWCNEGHAWRDLTVTNEKGNKCWAFQSHSTSILFSKPEIKKLGKSWYDHEFFTGTNFKTGFERIMDETDGFMASLGFIHDRENNCYTVSNPKYKRVALFAHQGFGLAFLSALCDIPYPEFCTRFDIGHTGVTVIRITGSEGESVIPKILQLSNDSHLYKEGISTKYNNLFEL